MLNKKLIFIAVILSISNAIIAQNSAGLTTKDSVVTSSWFVGIGYNIVDDSASPTSDIFDIKETWNALSYPSSITVGKTFKNGLGLKTIGSFNTYKIGKIIDGQPNLAERNYYAIDVLASYDLNKIIGETSWFDPFLQGGAGYSDIGAVGRTTANVGFGFNTWFNDRLGLNFNTMGKWGIKEGSTKQLQHSAGLVYRFNVEKDLSKKGMEKSLVLEQMANESKRVNDSITLADKNAKEAQKIQEQLELEKERRRLVQLDEEKEKRENTFRNDINALGNVYFDLNSSYLAGNSKSILLKLAEILKANPELIIEVNSHTDSRGSDPYNQWLSEKRVKRTIDYMITLGINENRLVGKAYGEVKLTNECDDSTYCTEEKHKQNRRSEFLIINF